MKKRRNNIQVMTIAILLVAVVGLSIGFAAFSNILTISSSATVTPNASTFNVDFSSSFDEVVAGNLPPYEIYDVAVNGGNEGEDAIIDNSGNPTVKNIKVKLISPGQYVTYKFYAFNIGEYDAYLDSVNFLNALGENTHKVCTAKDGTSQKLVDEACKDVVMTINVNGTKYENTTENISGFLLRKQNKHEIEIKIEYLERYDDDLGDLTNILADGDFEVSFGDISLTYTTAGQVVVPQFTFEFEDGSPSRTYSFEQGMTWTNWLNSEYNVDNLEYNDGVLEGEGIYWYVSSFMSVDDPISSGTYIIPL